MRQVWTKKKITKKTNDIVLDDKEYTSKKTLYKHYNIRSLKCIPKGYKVSGRWQNKNGIKTRLNKSVEMNLDIHGCF